MQKPDVSTRAKAAAVGIEDMIRHNTVETGVLIDLDGATRLKRSGRQDRVGFTHSELLRAKGLTFTHNHPSGYGPSLQDVQIGIVYGMKEVRVVTRRYRHSVSMLGPQQLDLLSRGFDAAEAGSLLAVRDGVKRGLIHPRDLCTEVRHRTWQRMAAQVGFDYWRQES